VSVAAEMLAIMREADSRLALPAVARLHVPRPVADPSMDAEFGLVSLADGSTGFFYAWLGDTLQRLCDEQDRPRVLGRTAMEIAAGFESEDPVARTVGLGAISAVAQHVFRRAGLPLERAASSFGGLSISDADHVGMVGLFPSLAKRLRERGVRLTVVELNAAKVEVGEGFEVTLDASKLRRCNRILCTASTLLNDTLDDILRHCAHAEQLAVIGPTAACFPDPLFARGVDSVGGSTVVDIEGLLGRIERGESWGDTVRRYTLDASSYPGFRSLIA